MRSNQLTKTFWLTILLVTGFIAYWEYHWRSKGFLLSFNDDKIIWADKRKLVYGPRGETTVFIGGSRIKFDLDLDTWHKLTGENGIQLAIVGTQVKQVLLDLGNDEKFRGKLIVDVAEAQFFRKDDPRSKKVIGESLEYYYNETPAQKASANIDFALESKMVFLEETRFGLNNLLNELMVPNRPGMVPIRGGAFKKESVICRYNRQALLTPAFLSDTGLQHAQIRFWQKSIELGYRAPVIKGDSLNIFFRELKTAIDKIRARGGTVLFVRPPSTQDYIIFENKRYPRSEYWDRLLSLTNTPGIHFADYTGMAALKCPEMSHLSPAGAISYTEQLVTILREKGWFTSGKQLSLADTTNLKNHGL